MKILFLDAYFEPEQIAFTHLENDLLERLVNAGHEVEIVCPTPTRGVSVEIAKEYKKRKSESLYNGHVHVTRFYAPQEGKNTFLRALRYFWCNLRSYQIGKGAKGVDCVFANSTPPTQGWIAGKIARKLGVPFIYSLQDIFPDSLVNAGITKNGSAIWIIGRKIEDCTYRYAGKIIVISEGFNRNIIKKGVPANKIEIISNWVDLSTIKPVERKQNKLFDELEIDRSRFIVVYAGNIGEAQGAEVIIDAAKKVAMEHDIQFVIFGGGARYQEIKDKAEKEKLKNVFITGLQPQERVSEVYSMGDVALITCKPGTGNAGMPSKTWNIMACNTPIIASFDTHSDLADVIRVSEAGCCVEPGNPEALSVAIKEAYESWKQGKSSTPDIRRYAIKTTSKEVCVQKYVEAFLSI